MTETDLLRQIIYLKKEVLRLSLALHQEQAKEIARDEQALAQKLKEEKQIQDRGD